MDASNLYYAAWMALLFGSEGEAMQKELNSSLAEVWADMVEASLGLAALIERIPSVGAHIIGPVAEMRTSMES